PLSLHDALPIYRHVVAVALPEAALGLEDHRRVLTVRGDRHASLGEDTLERRGVVDEQVAGRSAHEYLDAAHLRGRGAADLVEVGVRRAEIEAVVRVARPCR